MTKKYLIITLLLLLTLAQVSGLRMSPAATTHFGVEEQTREITISSGNAWTTNYRISAEEEIEPFIQGLVSELTVEPGEEEKISFTISIPGLTAPGKYEGRIIVEEEGQTGSQVGVVGAVGHKVTIEIPADGAFPALELLVSSPIEGQPLTVSALIKNIGTQPAEQVTGIVSLGTQTKQETFTAIAPGETSKVELTWETALLGTHTAVAQLIYQGNEQRIEETVEVGTLSVSLEAPIPSPYSPGEILKVEQPVTNLWNEPTPVYVEHNVAGKVFKSNTEAIEPGETRNIPVYWDLDNELSGEYQVEVTGYFGGETTSETYSIFIELAEAIEEVSKKSLRLLILTIMLVILLAGYAIWRIHADD